MQNTASPSRMIVAAPGFALEVVNSTTELLAIRFIAPAAATEPANTLAQTAQQQLSAWLNDPHSTFDLPLATLGSDFQRRVWAGIAAIPLGQTKTYGELAQLIGTAPRALGGACGANPFPIVVPCHRVVSASQSFNAGLGGFAHARDGLLLDIKRWLLTHEGAVV